MSFVEGFIKEIQKNFVAVINPGSDKTTDEGRNNLFGKKRNELIDGSKEGVSRACD